MTIWLIASRNQFLSNLILKRFKLSISSPPFHLLVPYQEGRVSLTPNYYVAIYEESLWAKLRFPFHPFNKIFLTYAIFPALITPNAICVITYFILLWPCSNRVEVLSSWLCLSWRDILGKRGSGTSFFDLTTKSFMIFLLLFMARKANSFLFLWTSLGALIGYEMNLSWS